MGILTVGLILVIGYFLGQVLEPLGRLLVITVPFIVAIVLAWVIQPVYIFLKDRIGRDYVASALSALFVVLIILKLVTGITLILGTTVTNEVNLVIRDNDLIIMVTTIIYILPIMPRVSNAIKCSSVPKKYRETFGDIYYF
jgi:predicted PurR-regulated permease PerM